MNNFVFPYPPNINNYYLEELKRLNERISILEEKIKTLENKNINNYLKKDDNYYML